MKAIKPTVSIIQKSYVAKDNTQEVRIRVRFPRADKSYDTGVSLSVDQFDKLFRESSNRKKTSEEREAYSKVMARFTKAEEVAQTALNPEAFDVLFNGASTTLMSVQDVCTLIIDERKARTEKLYRTVSYREFQVVKNYLNEKYERPVSFMEIDGDWLKDFEANVYSERKVSVNTVGNYHAAIRQCFKYVIYKLKILSPAYYPYGEGGYKVAKETKTHNNFLRGEDKLQWLNYVPKNEREEIALDYWKLSYYLVGANFKDIFVMRFKQIEGFQQFKYVREKNKGKRRVVEITCEIHPEAKKIIHRRMQKTLDPNAYVFPLLQEGMPYKKLQSRVGDLLERFNKVYKSIYEREGMARCITTKFARHTHSDTLIQNGATNYQLQQHLGHTEDQTTEKYKHRMGSDDSTRLIMGL